MNESNPDEKQFKVHSIFPFFILVVSVNIKILFKIIISRDYARHKDRRLLTPQISKLRQVMRTLIIRTLKKFLEWF